MKKITLFLFALLAMVSSANAQRAWAYGLGLASEGDSYTFTFKATTAANATLVLYQDGAEVSTVDLGSVVAGDNTFTLTKDQINQVGIFNWGVKLTGNAVLELTQLTDDSQNNGFWFAYGVGVNNCPESEYFGNIYISNPRHSSKPKQTGFYKYNPELVLDNSIFEDGEKVGYKPANVDLANAVDAIQRMAVSPVDGTVAFVQWNKAPFAAYGMNPANLAGDAVNLTEGINQPVALCYDHEGSLCVLSYDGKSGGVSVYGIYIIKNGEKTTFFSQAGWVAGGYCEIASDGQGGFYVMSGNLNASNVVTSAKLQHISKKGVIDLTVLPGGEELVEAPSNFNRLRLAYDLKHDVFAIVGDKKVNLYNATYDAETGAPTLTKWISTPEIGNNVDGVAFDYAGDLYVVSAATETFYKYALPTNDNTCTTPAPKTQEVVLGATQYQLTIIVNGNGSVTGAESGQYAEGKTFELTATPAEHNKFIGWTYGDASSTDNTLSITLNSDLTITANFEELPQYSVTAHIAPDPNMGTVEGASMYYEGQEVTLTAKANQGYAFVKWDDETTEPTITFEATADVIRTAYFKKVATRAWAYGLEMTEGADDYTFQFTTTADGEVKILFKDMDGNELIQYPIGALEAGEHTQAVPKTYFADIHKDAYWSVQIDGAEITELTELTADTDAYRFYCPQGVVVDNSTESETFGQIYVAQSMNGGTDGKTERTETQKRGLFLLDQNLKSLNPTDNEGILPSNIEWDAKGRQSIHRIAINPVTHQLAMAYNVAPGAVWSVAANNVAGEATNLIAGTAITLPNSICFDEEGALYVMDNANATTGGTIYKVVNGVAEVFGAQNTTWANIENALASDGRGGLWFLQYRGQLDGYNILTHLNAEGQIDFEVNATTPNGFTSQSTHRGAMAYNPRENMLAIGIGPDGQIGVSLYKVTYDETTGVPSLALFAQTLAIGANVDGLGFDYAGDLYVVSAAEERFYKFVVPTEENICEVPAAKNQAIKLGAQCTVTVLVNEEAMGTVSGAGDYEVGAIVTLTASAAPEHRFLRWTKDDVEVSTEEIYSFVAAENVTLVAHFEAISKYNISAGANDGAMGTVTGGGEYLEGESVELSATANPGYVFVEWNDGEKSATRTITVTEEATYTAFFKAIEARAWAYALNMVEDGDNYVFSFNATATAEATLHFEYTDGTPAFDHTVGQVTAGPVAPIAIAKSQFAGTKDIRWSVELDGEEIDNVYQLTDASDDNLHFYLPQDVKVNNNPNSEYFGTIYVAEPYAGAGDGGSEHTQNQKAGIYVYNPALEIQNYDGHVPSNVTLNAADKYNTLHRLAIHPLTSEVVFTQGVGAYVWAADPANLTAEATNLAEGTGIAKTNSVCFDENGVMYILDATTVGGGTLYKVEDGVTTAVVSTPAIANDRNSLAADGHGGVWIGQNRGQMDAYNYLTHVNAAGAIDYEVNVTSAEEVKAMFAANMNRGHIAYDAQRDVLAIGGGGKVTLLHAEYDENGTPTLTKWTETPMLNPEKPGWNIDGLAFDYAGDLYVMCASNETFYKYVLPTVENICVVPAAKVIEVDKPKYTREVEADNFGTICLPYGSSNYTGAEFYEIAYLELEADGTTPKGIWLDEVVEPLVAGKPYIFLATADELVVYYEGEEVLNPVEGEAGLTGIFVGITDGSVLEGNYMIYNNTFVLCEPGCWLDKNRAYIEHDALHDSTTPVSPIPGRRRVCMGAAGDNQATGLEGLITPNNQAAKVIKNGRLIIIRGSEMYNAQGVRL